MSAMDERKVVISTRGGRTTCDPLFAESWTDFDRIAAILQRDFGAKTKNAFDGPDARRWIFQTQDGTIELQYDDMGGNIVISMEPGTDALVERIGRSLEQALRVAPEAS
jgi:hypothetical protein